MSKHRVTPKELSNFTKTEKVIFSRSIQPEGTKELYCTLLGLFQVLDNGKLISETDSLIKACIDYNSI